MQSNLSMVPKRYLVGAGLFLLLVLGLIIGAVHPYKQALGSQPVALPDVQVLQVQQEDVPIYILWRACPKNAWLRIHKPDVFDSAELTEYEQSVIEMGIEVERVARGLFPDGATITGARTDALQETRSLISSRTRTLFQPVLEREGLLAFTDVLERELGTDEWSIYEVKSATKLKEEHVYDLAFQVVLLRKHGISVTRAFLILLNPEYVRQDDLDIQKLFNTIDITANLDDISETVSREMQEARDYLLNETEPQGPCSCIYKARSRHRGTFHYSNPDVSKITSCRWS